MPNVFSSFIFGARNAGIAINDNPARTPVVFGQGANVVHELSKMSNSAAAFFKSLDNGSKAMQYLKAGSNFAADHLNPLICAAGAYKVLTADDKEKEFVNQTASLGVMFCAEKAYKTLVDYKNIKKVANVLGQSDNLKKLANSSIVKNITNKVGNKKIKLALNIAYGLGFVAASMTGYNIGEKLAKKATNSDEISKQKAQLAQMQHFMKIPAHVYSEVG